MNRESRSLGSSTVAVGPLDLGVTAAASHDKHVT